MCCRGRHAKHLCRASTLDVMPVILGPYASCNGVVGWGMCNDCGEGAGCTLAAAGKDCTCIGCMRAPLMANQVEVFGRKNLEAVSASCEACWMKKFPGLLSCKYVSSFAVLQNVQCANILLFCRYCTASQYSLKKPASFRRRHKTCYFRPVPNDRTGRCARAPLEFSFGRSLDANIMR